MNTACGTESTSSRSAVEIMAVSLLAALLGFRDTVSAAIKNMTLDELKRAALQVGQSLSRAMRVFSAYSAYASGCNLTFTLHTRASRDHSI